MATSEYSVVVLVWFYLQACLQQTSYFVYNDCLENFKCLVESFLLGKPIGSYLFEVNSGNSRTICEKVSSKEAIKKPD